MSTKKTQITADTTLTEIAGQGSLAGCKFFIITTEVEKDWAGKKNSVTTQRGMDAGKTVLEEIDFLNSLHMTHNHTMENIGRWDKNAYDHAH